MVGMSTRNPYELAIPDGIQRFRRYLITPSPGAEICGSDKPGVSDQNRPLVVTYQGCVSDSFETQIHTYEPPLITL